MPRKSAASLALAGRAGELVQRPAPPADLTDIQRLYWVQISNPLPADWWREDNKALLAEYCRTLSTLAFLNAQIDKLESAHDDDFDAGSYLALLKRRESMVRIQLSQATKMRLTQQSRYGHKQANTAAEKPRGQGKTWEFK